MEATKSSNCCVVCGRKLFWKKDCTNYFFRVFSCDFLGDGCRWCYLRRMQEACRRAQTNWIVTFYRVIAISSWSFEVLTFLWAFFRALTVLLVQCASNSRRAGARYEAEQSLFANMASVTVCFFEKTGTGLNACRKMSLSGPWVSPKAP